MRKFDLEELYAFDYETELMGPKRLAPPSVCFSIAQKEQGGYLISEADKGYQDYIRSLFQYAFDNEKVTLVAHNLKFDLWVFLKENPDFYGKICLMLNRGQLVCSVLIEKLINLTTTGRIASTLPRNPHDEDAKGTEIKYDLATLIFNYLGKDVSMSKTEEDAVRKRFVEMKGTPSQYYPKKFKDYAIDDSVDLLQVVFNQLERRDFIIEEWGRDPLTVLAHRCSLDFHLYSYSMRGVATNEYRINKMADMLEEELSFEKLNLLYPPYVPSWDDEEFWHDHEKVEVYLKRDRNLGFLKPSYPAHPAFTWSHKKNCPKPVDEYGIPTCDDRCFRRVTKDHTDECKANKSKQQCKFTRQWLCDCPPKYKQAEKHLMAGKEYVLDENGKKIPISKDILNGEKLKKHIIDLWYNNPDAYDLIFTDKARTKKGDWAIPELQEYTLFQAGHGDKEKAYKALIDNWACVGTKSEWMDVYAFKDPVLSQYAHRQGLIKLKTTELPRMTDRTTGKIADVIHANFDVLKETGRTSGYASKLYPSFNAQNVHKMARTCYKAQEGHWMLSTDYSSLEFVAAAQRAYDRLGRSVYKKIFDNGWDAHSYLAAQRAYRSEDWFNKECTEEGIGSSDHESIYHRFFAYKKNDKQIGYYDKKDENGNKVKKMFFKHYRNSAKPIGLGILGGMGARMIAHVSAAQYKIEMTVEESKEYKAIWEEIFEPEAEMIRLINIEHKDHRYSSKKKAKFIYETPMGMVRPNCSFAACSNGHLLQSPSAEGATLAVIEIAKAAYDPESTSILKGNFFPSAFIHDEILGDVVADPVIATQVAEEVERIMCKALNVICPDVTCAADSAFMIEWSKKADELRNRDGYLVPWECSFDKELAEKYNYEIKETA